MSCRVGCTVFGAQPADRETKAEVARVPEEVHHRAPRCAVICSSGAAICALPLGAEGRRQRLPSFAANDELELAATVRQPLGRLIESTACPTTVLPEAPVPEQAITLTRPPDARAPSGHLPAPTTPTAPTPAASPADGSHRHRPRCPQDGDEMSRTRRHISEAVHPKLKMGFA